MSPPPQPSTVPKTSFDLKLRPKVGWKDSNKVLKAQRTRRARTSEEATADAQVSEEPTERIYAPRVMPEWWNSTSPLSSPPSSLHSPTPSPPPTIKARPVRSRTPAPPPKKTPRKPASIPKKKDHFEHPPEDVHSSFYWPEQEEDDVEEDTEGDTEADTNEDAEEDIEGDGEEVSKKNKQRGPSCIVQTPHPWPAPSSGLSKDEDPESPPTSPVAKTPTPKKTGKKEKKEKKDKIPPVKSKPKHKTTVGGRIEKEEATERVQCNGWTKKKTQCGHKKTLRVGEKWNCGRHK